MSFNIALGDNDGDIVVEQKLGIGHFGQVFKVLSKRNAANLKAA